MLSQLFVAFFPGSKPVDLILMPPADLSVSAQQRHSNQSDLGQCQTVRTAANVFKGTKRVKLNSTGASA